MMSSRPTEHGFFGEFGGRFVPPPLESALIELEAAFERYRTDAEFQMELDYYLRQFVGRANPLYFAARLSEHLGGARVYLKREDLNHTGAHKINNALGQVLLAKRMGKVRVVAETGAGQHGVATATVCALFGLACTIYMGEKDTKRQALNVFRMELLGAKVVPVAAGAGTLKEAVDEALLDYAQNVGSTFYLLGSAVGPHPFPLMVREFQSVIGREAREQIMAAEGRLPDYLIACVGGGSNAIGLFAPFYEDKEVRIIGVEPGGLGVGSGQHAASLVAGQPDVMHGFRSYMLQDTTGEPLATHSVAAGLNYPGVGPEHSFYRDSGRAEYVAVTDAEALEAFKLLSRLEGIIPALESAHAVAQAVKLAPNLGTEQIIIVNLSGRGDKDVAEVGRLIRGEDSAGAV